MTDEQINTAIAKACGWINLHSHSLNPTVWVGDEPLDDGRYLPFTQVPDYCTDLNAMHEAEKTIFPFYATVYFNKLAKVTGSEMSDDTDYFCATARQRAEAFLRILGKWEKATDKDSLTVQPTTENCSVDHTHEI